MRFSLRIFLGFFLLVAGLGGYGLRLVQDELKPTVRQSTEEVLIDTANLLADMIAEDFASGRLSQGRFQNALENYQRRQPNARIWGIPKNTVDFRVYVTDERGIVKLDSAEQALGQDYSQWRDVHLTLRGEYGARTTRSDPQDPNSSTMYVAAPVHAPDGHTIIGVLAVGKSNHTIEPYIRRMEGKITQATWLLLLACLILGGLFSWWLSRGITRLTNFALSVSKGENAPTPTFVANRELSELAKALNQMRSELDGKAHVEHTIYGLTHELKSPLTGIRGAAEVLSEPLDQEQSRRFADHILREVSRMQQVVDRMLELARLEARQSLDTSPLNLSQIVQVQLDALSVQLQGRRFQTDIPPDAWVCAEDFLLSQAIRNLLQNALDFTPEHGQISVNATPAQTPSGQPAWLISIHNQGPAIPEYALARLFERFYSLPGPFRHNKSSGLGLALTRTIVGLHRGTIHILNAPQGGVRADLLLPAAPTP